MAGSAHKAMLTSRSCGWTDDVLTPLPCCKLNSDHACINGIVPLAGFAETVLLCKTRVRCFLPALCVGAFLMLGQWSAVYKSWDMDVTVIWGRAAASNAISTCLFYSHFQPFL